MIPIIADRSETVPGPLEALPPVSLAELQDEAAFLTRIDRKYLVPEHTLTELLTNLESGTRALEIAGRRAFGYSTRYFDADHTAYFRALRKRADRFKVRTRLYDESGECLLEVKLIDRRGRTVKQRIPHDPQCFESLSMLDRAWLQSFEAVRPVASGLNAGIATHYRRSTLVFPTGRGRMTIDQSLTFIGPDGSWRQLVGFCVVEVKGAGRPLSFDRQLWAHGYRPLPSSKFALGTSLLHPELPSNRWRRLRRIFETATIAGYPGDRFGLESRGIAPAAGCCAKPTDDAWSCWPRPNETG